MDDLIIIILTLIIAAVGTIGQIKKKKQAQTEPDETVEESSGDFWSFLDEFTEQPQQQENVAKVNEVETVPEKKDEKPKYSFTAENEGRNSLEKEITIKDEIKESSKDEKKEKISDTFSLKKAVIYSEILNRKYS